MEVKIKSWDFERNPMYGVPGKKMVLVLKVSLGCDGTLLSSRTAGGFVHGDVRSW